MFIFNQFRQSLKEFSSVRSLACAGMLLALNVVFGYYANFTLGFLPTVEIGLGFLPTAIGGAMFGPLFGGIIAALGDVISFFLNPVGGAFFPGWTIDALLVGMVYGVCLYKGQVTLKRLIIAKAIIVAIELFAGTLWLLIQFNLPYWVTFGGRAIKQLVCLPLEIAVIYFIGKAMKRANLFKEVKQ